MNESRVFDLTTQASKLSTRHLVDDVAMQERSGANSIADDSDKSFEVPLYLQRKNKRCITQKMLTGTAASSDIFMAARNGNSVRELFVSLESKEVKPDGLKNYVESMGFIVVNFKCVSHNEAENSSYKLTVPVSEFGKMFDSSVWPEGISMRRF